MKAMLALVCLLGLAVGAARAENAIVVESKTVPAGATDVHVGVFVTNDFYLVGFTLPLEIRSLTPGAYVSEAFTAEVMTTGRLYSEICASEWPQEPICWPWRYPSPDTSSCSGPVSHTYRTSGSQIDFISPDAVMLVGVSMGDAGTGSLRDISVAPGADPHVSDLASIRLRFGATTALGQFEIDTCCVRPAVHLAFVDTLAQTIIPSFTKGTITIVECICPCIGDPVCDGAYDILDVIRTIDVAFRGGTAVVDPACPVARTDLNADGVTDLVDAVRMTFIAFMGYLPGPFLVNPCD